MNTSQQASILRPSGPSKLLRFAGRNQVGVVTFLIIAALYVISWVGPILGSGDPEAINVEDLLSSPSAAYPLGTDHLGRNVLARLVIALRISLFLAILAALLAALLGTIIGLSVGYLRGKLDELTMRLMDMLFAFPSLLMAILVSAIIGRGITGLVITIVLITIPTFSRVVRGPVLSVRERDYVTAARLMGATDWRIVGVHILPNVLAPLLVQATYTLSVTLVIEGSLSFLGLGVQPPTPSLGSMLAQGKVYMEIAPWMVVFPGIALALAIVAINVFGDWLRDFLDPKLRRIAR